MGQFADALSEGLAMHFELQQTLTDNHLLDCKLICVESSQRSGKRWTLRQFSPIKQTECVRIVTGL